MSPSRSDGPTVEYKRLMRAIEIVRAGEHKATWERLGPQQFKVIGNDQPFYYVDLTQEQRCWCKDAEFAPRYERMCKHEMAMRLVNMEPGMLTHMMEVVYKEEQRKLQAA